MFKYFIIAVLFVSSMSINLYAKDNNVNISENAKNTQMFLNNTANFIISFEGSVLDSNGLHTAYDDADPKHKWEDRKSVV